MNQTESVLLIDSAMPVEMPVVPVTNIAIRKSTIVPVLRNVRFFLNDRERVDGASGPGASFFSCGCTEADGFPLLSACPVCPGALSPGDAARAGADAQAIQAATPIAPIAAAERGRRAARRSREGGSCHRILGSIEQGGTPTTILS